MDSTSVTVLSPLVFSLASSGFAMAIVGNTVPKPNGPSTSGKLTNCSRTYDDQNQLFIPKLISKDLTKNDVVNDVKTNNCTEDLEVVMKKMQPDIDNWKNQVIIGCTFTVAIEILIVVLMVMYWQQIRWTLRKLSCPCDRRWDHHTAMNRREPADVIFDSDSDEATHQQDDEIQVFTPPDENPNSNGRLLDNMSFDGRVESFSALEGASAGEQFCDTWDVFAASSSDDELEDGSEVVEPRGYRLSQHHRTGSW